MYKRKWIIVNHKGQEEKKKVYYGKILILSVK